MQPKHPSTRGPIPAPAYQPPSAPPIPVQSQAGSTSNVSRSGGSATAAKGGLQTSNQYLRTPIVRYSSQMRVGKQHPMRISLTGANGEADLVKPQSLSGGFDPPIVIQVTIPGALVSPNHQIIPLSGGDANFIVQPISSGRLKGAKVEFLSQGRKISEIPLPIRANKGRLAKWLFFIGILLPFLINFMPELVYQDRPSLTGEPIRRNPVAGATRVSINSSTNPDQPRSENQKAGEAEKNASAKTPPQKSPEKAPAKSVDKKEGKTPGKPSTSILNINPLHSLVSGLFIALQPVETNRAQRNTSDADNKATDAAGQTQAPGKKSTENGKAENSDSPMSGSDVISSRSINYRGENAIWAWIRHKVNLNGYTTIAVSPGINPGEISRFFSVDREYQITGETSNEWTSGRVGAMALYYLEPALRLLYRVFIQFPRDIPLADLGYCLFFIALSVVVWILTGPNRKKIKGSVMDIRLAS